MPLHQLDPDPSLGASRRAFLARTAAGGVVVASLGAVGAVGGIGAGSPAGAQAEDDDAGSALKVADFAAIAVPLELAAGIAYQAALSSGTLDPEWTATLRRFQRHHQEVASLLGELLDEEAAAPVADTATVTRFSPPAGADQGAILAQLAGLEEGLAATHLSVIGELEDTSRAKTVAQVCATEQQQAVALGRASGVDVATLTPAEATVDGALQPGAAAPAATTEPTAEETTESTEASETSETTAADTETTEASEGETTTTGGVRTTSSPTSATTPS